MGQEFPLSWIDEETLIGLVRKHFGDVASGAKRKTIAGTDPTLNIIRKAIFNLSDAKIAEIEEIVNVTKTLQNKVGAFHQDVIGHAAGWETTGNQGGVLDVKSKNPIKLVGNKKVLAEVKMRYNTIKASDEEKVWDRLRDAVRMHGTETHVAYIFQIIPSKGESYDRPWKVSGRAACEEVRAADGVTAYHIVTGDPEALFKFFHVLPSVFKKAFPDRNQADGDGQTASEFEAFVEEALRVSLPEQSGLYGNE